MDVKPIQTVYNGYKFRSRLEARWAVFFDAAGIKYEYEPEGFDMDGLYYLPDFYLPEYDVWVEIKGAPLCEQDRVKIEKFCQAKCDFANGKSRFRLLEGQIPSSTHLPLDGSAIPCFTYFSPKEICNAVNGTDIEPFGVPQNGALIYTLWVPDATKQIIKAALLAARQARFEHGETPNTIKEEA